MKHQMVSHMHVYTLYVHCTLYVHTLGFAIEICKLKQDAICHCQDMFTLLRHYVVVHTCMYIIARGVYALPTTHYKYACGTMYIHVSLGPRPSLLRVFLCVGRKHFLPRTFKNSQRGRPA